MLVQNIFEMFKLTKYSIGFKKNLCTKINRKPNSFLEDTGKFNKQFNSNYDAKYKECIKNGISSDAVLLNNWIFNMNISKLNVRKIMHD